MDSSFPQKPDFTKETEQHSRNDPSPNIAKYCPWSQFCLLQLPCDSAAETPSLWFYLLTCQGWIACPSPHLIRLLDGSPNPSKIKYLKVLEKYHTKKSREANLERSSRNTFSQNLKKWLQYSQVPQQQPPQKQCEINGKNRASFSPLPSLIPWCRVNSTVD